MINQVSIKVNKTIICFILFAINTQLFAQDQNITFASSLNADRSVDINYTKILPGTYYVIVEFSNITNCNINKFEGPIYGYSGNLVRLKPNDPSQGINFTSRSLVFMGNPDAKIDSLFQYTLPFKSGKKVKIDEANNLGEKYFGSEKPLNWKSFVINFKSPDTVYSMRKGVVVKIVNNYTIDTTYEKTYTSKRNYIIVEHEDGTFGEYKGFQQHSIKVKLGQTVYPETQLGTIEMFNKKRLSYRFDFSIYYLFDANFNDTGGKETFKNRKSRYKYINPYFLTPDGSDTVDSKKEYTALFNDEQLMKELTRSEKKRYIKDPSFFK